MPAAEIYPTGVVARSRRGPGGRRVGPITATVALTAVLIAATGRAQRQQVQPGRRGGAQRINVPVRRAPTVLVEASAPVTNLFLRAEEGIQRNDWKFAIDSLQRIIDKPDDSLVARPEWDRRSVEGTVQYESARRRAVRRLASLGDEALRGYRLLFDGRAKRLYESAKSSHDPRPLRVVVNRYLLTRYGPPAADLLASWALDAGRPGEAAAVLTDLLDLVEQHDLPDSLIVSKLAAAYAMQGRTADAKAVLEAYEEKRAGKTDERVSATTDTLAALLATAEMYDHRRSWPMIGGGPGRRGIMSPVDPTLVPNVPWRFDLPDGDTNAWRRAYANEADDAPWLPVTHAVIDDNLLVIRTTEGCAALDVEDLTLKWRTDDAPRTQDAQSPGPQRRGGGPVARPVATARDYMTGEVAMGDGVVWAIARGGRGTYVQRGRDEGGRRGLRWIPLPGAAARQVEGTRLVAYDAQSGDLRWQRGRTGDPEDPLGDVVFRSVPLPVSDELWVPYFRRGDFHVAVLDPRDGALIRTTLLCSVTDSILDPMTSLSPAAADGVVFVPSGNGILFALDKSDYALRWATQYAFLPEQRGRVLEENAWRSSPPIVSAGVVLLASPAHPNLLAFSAATGRRRWSTPIDRGASLIGADLKQVWVSGRSVASLSLLDGELIWKRELPSPPTGRAVVCGDRILAPTVDGLVTIAAGTGEVLAHDSIPDGSEPLGNAVCHGAALYVVGPASVRKFPDLVRSFKVARLAYERAPTDAMAAMRLAWLHLFTEEPQQAVAVLSSLHDEPAGGDPVRADRVAHVRVEALLALARRATSDPAVASDESPPPDVLALLQRAEQTARSPGDRLRSGLAIADHLAASGKAEVACGRLWELGLDSMGDQIVPIGDHVVGPARLQIARQLEAVVAGLDEDQRRRIRALETKRAQATLDKLLGRESTGDKSPVTGDAPPDGARYTPTARQARLRAIGALAPFSAVGQRALLSLAGESERALHFEQAELLYREAARWNADPELTLAGLTRLGEMYLASNRLGVVMDDMLLGVLDAIESQYASAALPATGRTDTPPVPSRTTEVNPADSAADSALNWVHRIRSEVPESTRKAHRLTRSDAPVRLTGVAGWSISWDQQRDAPQRLVSFGPSLPEVLWDRVVVRNMDDVISCYAADSGELVWQAVLRAPESFPATPQRSQRPRRTSQRRYAVADGQTGVFSAASGLFAVGLATGRRLWMRPYHLAGEVRAPANRDLLMAAGDGFLAATPNAGRLTLMRLEDGTTVWERDLRNDTVDRIQMEGNRIMASSARRELTLILDRAGGELLQRVAWDQPDPEHDVVDLVIESQVLSGPKSWAHTHGIVGVDLTTGETAWRLPLDKPLDRLFPLGEGFLGVGLLGGEVQIVRAKSGERVFTRRVAGTRRVVGGALIDGTLLIQHAAQRPQEAYQLLAALDIATGTELWRHDAILSLSLGGAPLGVVGGQVPTVVLPRPGDRRNRQAKLMMLDVRTGTETGPRVSPGASTGPTRLNGDFVILPAGGVLVVGAQTAIHAVRIQHVVEEAEEGL